MFRVGGLCLHRASRNSDAELWSCHSLPIRKDPVLRDRLLLDYPADFSNDFIHECVPWREQIRRNSFFVRMLRLSRKALGALLPMALPSTTTSCLGGLRGIVLSLFSIIVCVVVRKRLILQQRWMEQHEGRDPGSKSSVKKLPALQTLRASAGLGGNNRDNLQGMVLGLANRPNLAQKNSTRPKH